jgi:hypothetical protein
MYILYCITTLLGPKSPFHQKNKKKKEISTITFSCARPSAFYREAQLQEGITGNGFGPKSGTFPSNGTQLCAVLVTSSVLFEIQKTLNW